ncbi:Sodium- and chloride-dependent glycine transporter 2 [Bulinus truncatus]|nr:Sodium- and chloride-dependent glycine transporter 2 [Bulinus truncatus]
MNHRDLTAREGWVGKLDFTLTCIGYAVGLGNIWRFPYLCYKSGGGAFLIPYSLFLILCGLPLFFLEVTFGQFSSLSPVAIWKVAPLFKGVGIGMIMISAIVCIYYNVIIAWTVYYLFLSFRSVLPWSHCDNPWNTVRCRDNSGYRNATNSTNLFGNLSQTSVTSHNVTNNNIWTHKYVSASEEFWERHVLELSDGIENPGHVRWQLLICLAFSWLCVFFCLFKGVKILGKVMHFAAPFPYLVLTILLIRGCTLPGAAEGILFYIVPRWEKLADFNVWGDAALQIFYSVGMGWGGIITMASYNKFNHNVYRDSMLVPLINCGTSLFAGFVIFSVLGYMAHELNTSVDKIVTQGPGLTFVAYPQAIATMPISPLWSVLFFLMLFTVGLDSQFGMFETIISSLIDEFPQKLRNRKTVITAVACVVEFLLGLTCITQGGIYVLQIMDWYCASFSLMLISMTECLALAWAYGVDNLIRDIVLMTGKKPHWWWKHMWRFVTPTVITFIWIFSVVTLGPVTYGPSYKYPNWSIIFGWIVGVVSVIPIPFVAIYQIVNSSGPLLNRFRILTSPDPSWGPSQPEDRLRFFEELEKSKKIVINGNIDRKGYSISNGKNDESTVVFIQKK